MTVSHDQGNAPRARRFGRTHVSAWLFRLILALLLIVGATLVAVFSFEQSTLRPLAEYLVERATGRAFSIEGELDARAGRIISLHAGRISLANADWGSSDKLLSIDEAEVSIDLSHLLNGVLAIDKVMVNGVQLLFEQDAQGLSNWAMVSDEAPLAPDFESNGVMDTTSDNPPTATIENGNTMAFPVIHSQLSNIDITVHNAAFPQPIMAHFDSIEHSAAQGNELRATVVGAVQSRPLNLQARIGPLTQLLDAGAVDFDLKADFEAVELDVNGQLDNLLTPRQATLHASLVSPEISQILKTFGLPEIVQGATELKVSLQSSDDHHKFDLAASIDTLKLEAKARLQALNTIDGASITVSAAGPDLAAAASLAGLNGLPRQSFKLESSAELSGKLLTIGETGFVTGDSHLTAKGSMSQFPRLEGTNLKLKLVGKNYLDFAELLGIKKSAELKPESFEVNANLEYNAQDQQLITARLTLANISGDVNATLTGYPTYIGSKFDYRLEGQNGVLVHQLLGRPTQIDGEYALRGSVKLIPTGFDIDPTVLSVGANDLQVSGMIGEDPLHGDTELTMQFQGPDLDKIAAIAGYTGFLPTGSAEINAAARAQNGGIHLDNLTVQLGRNRLKAAGLISLQDGVNGSRVKVELVAEDIIDVLPPDLHAFVDPQQSFELAGTLATNTGQLEISALQARLGEVNLQASATVSMQQPLTDMSLTLDVGGPDLGAVIPEDLVPFSLPAAKFSVSGDIALTESGLTLDGIKALVGPDRLELSGTIPLDTPTDGLNLVITASGPNLREFVPLEPAQFEFTEQPYQLTAKIQLAEEIVSVQQIDFSTPQGRLSGQLSASLLNPRQFGQFDLKAKGDNLAEFAPSMPSYSPATAPFELDARGSWDAEWVNIDRGTLQIDDALIEVQGKVDLPPNVSGTRLVLSARGDNVTDLGQFTRLPLLPKKFSVEASLQGDVNSFEIPELNAQFGESNLRGSIQADFADKPLIKINLESGFLNLAKLIPSEESSPEVEAPTQAPTSDDRLIPQLPVPVDQLNAINLETRIKLRELRLAHHTLRNIEIDTRLQDGDLTVTRLRATATQGQIIAGFRIVVDGDRIVTRGKLEGKDIELGSTEMKEEGNSFPKQDFHLEFESSGATVRELAGNLNGYAQVTAGTGRLQNSLALGLFGSFFSELMNAVNPLVTRETYTTISCFGAYAEIIDGVAKINPGVVLQTDKLNMFAIGQVDLNTEQINLRFDTSARSGIGISVADFVNPFVGVSGTFATPRLGVDPENAMFEGGFAVATGGLSVVAKSLFNRWFGEKDPCALLQEQAQEVLESRIEKQNAEQPESTPDEQ